MTTSSIHFIIQPGDYLQGTLQVPGDKSISHRALMLGALAEGATSIAGFLAGEDCLATLQAFKQMGVKIQQPDSTTVIVQGVGLHGLQASAKPLDMQNAGTGMRLLAGILAGQQFNSILTGDESLSRRPMGRIAKPLRQMGAQINLQAGDLPPIEIQGGVSLHGIEYVLPMASAQVKSCLLLAGLYAQGKTVVIEPAPSRDHTEKMLQTFGVDLSIQKNKITLIPPQKLNAQAIAVPADISSAAFFMVGACIAPNSEIILKQVGINPTRIGIINILRMMGAKIEILNENVGNAEPIADIKVNYSPLHGIEIPIEQVPLAIDEFPAIFIAAACAKGETILRGAAELRVKESDRIAVMAKGLQILGISAEVLPDGIRIIGGKLQGGTINSAGDHRIAMAFAMAALAAQQPIIIQDCANVATSFPNFVSLAQQAGLQLAVMN